MLTEQRVKTVKDLYDYAVEHNEELLGNWQSSSSEYDFWLKYTADSSTYDRAFCNKYKNWYYFDQTGSETVEEVFNRFTEAVTDYLTLNDKKFTELYKVELLTIDNRSILSDHTMSQQINTERGIEREYVSGPRQDATSDTSGERTDTTLVQQMAYNSVAFADTDKTTDTVGNQTDSSTFNKGAQTDTEGTTDTLKSSMSVTGSNDNPYENMLKYIESWDSFSFYTMIFRELASELLLV